MPIRTNLILLALAAPMFGVLGCNKGVSTPGVNVSSSRFAGNWVGTYTDPVNGPRFGPTGVLSVTIASLGQATGSITDNTTRAGGSVDGTVDSSGISRFTYSSTSGSINARGTISINSAGHLVGNFTQYLVQTTGAETPVGTLTIDLIRQ